MIRIDLWQRTPFKLVVDGVVRVEDVALSDYSMDGASIRQKKTGRPVRFELTDQTRQAIDE